MKVDLRIKMAAVLFLAVCCVSAFFFYQSKSVLTEQFEDKARSVVLSAESSREEMARKWELGLFTHAQMKEWAQKGEKEKVLAVVPIVTAWKTAKQTSALIDESRVKSDRGVEVSREVEVILVRSCSRSRRWWHWPPKCPPPAANSRKESNRSIRPWRR